MNVFISSMTIWLMRPKDCKACILEVQWTAYFIFLFNLLQITWVCVSSWFFILLSAIPIYTTHLSEILVFTFQRLSWHWVSIQTLKAVFSMLHLWFDEVYPYQCTLNDGKRWPLYFMDCLLYPISLFWNGSLYFLFCYIDKNSTSLIKIV